MALYGISEHYRSHIPRSHPTSTITIKPYRQQINIQVLAEIHFDSYDFDLALAVYHELLGLFSLNAKVLFNIGQIHLLLGERRESASWFEKAVTCDPFLAVALFQLGAVYMRLGDFSGARNAYHRCRNTVVRGKRGALAERVDYDQLGMRYTLHQGDIERNQRWCENKLGVSHTWPINTDTAVGIVHEKQITSVSAGTIFRVSDRKARARGTDPAKTAEWRFRDEAKVLATSQGEAIK